MSQTTAVAEEQWARPDKVADVMAGTLTEADVSWWGFDAEDSTRFLQAAINSPVRKLKVPKAATPWITKPLFIKRNQLVIEFAQGVILEAKRGEFHGRLDFLIRLDDSSGITLRGYGATLRMHKQDYWEPAYRRSEWRMIIGAYGCSDLTIEGLTLFNGGGDGIFIGANKVNTYTKNVVVRDVICDGNNRQGMSVISAENMLVERCIFKNTMGSAPMAGIDLEPDHDWHRIVNIVIRNCIFLDNSQLGMHMFFGYLSEASEPVSVHFVNNYIRGGELGIHINRMRDGGPEGLIIIEDNMVEGTHHAGIMLPHLSAGNRIRVKFARNHLVNTTRRGPYDQASIDFYSRRSKPELRNPGTWNRPIYTSAPIIILAEPGTTSKEGEVSFDNDLIIDERDEPIFVLEDMSMDHIKRFSRDKENIKLPLPAGRPKISGTLRVINPHGARMKVQTKTADFSLEFAED